MCSSKALGYFEDAEQTSPGWYTGNLLFLGKTYQKLSNNSEAKKYLTKLLDFEAASNPEDAEVRMTTRIATLILSSIHSLIYSSKC